MIWRQHQTGDTVSEALYSDCGLFRYALTRIWRSVGSRMLFVLLNPSTASEVQNDPTVARCEQRARQLGHGAFRVVNLFALRATAPLVMRAASDPVGPHNDAVLQESVTVWQPDLVLCGWGLHGAYLGRGRAVAQTLSALDVPLFHLGLTKGGEPRHPLYLSYDCLPQRWI